MLAAAAVSVPLVPSLDDVYLSINLVGDNPCFLRQLDVLLRKLIQGRLYLIEPLVGIGLAVHVVLFYACG
jgi:hypothetical protein